LDDRSLIVTHRASTKNAMSPIQKDNMNRQQDGPTSTTRGTDGIVLMDPACITKFTTVELPPEERMIVWQEYLSGALLELQCRSLKPDEFEGTTISLQLAHTHLAHTKTATPAVVERRPKMIRQHPADAIVLQFVLGGEAFVFHDDGIRTVRPGQLFVCDADKPYMGGFSAGYRELLLKVSRHAFHQATGLMYVEAPLFKSFSLRHGAVAASLAERMRDALRPNDGQWQEEELLRLVGAMWCPDADAHSSAYLASARSFVDGRLSDDTLCVATIAAAVGISPRHLSRIFSRAGSTVPQYVLGRRLDAARKMLEQPSSASMTIGEVATRCGFRSNAYFSSAFTARFGHRPSDIRRMAPHHPISSQLSRTA
jgi:AraC-like DNA-binding protein